MHVLERQILTSQMPDTVLWFAMDRVGVSVTAPRTAPDALRLQAYQVPGIFRARCFPGLWSEHTTLEMLDER